MSEIVKGDVVQLKSGGPEMTVAKVSDYSAGMSFGPKEGAECHWFDGKKPMSQVFDVDILKKS